MTKLQIRCVLHSACNPVKPFLQQFTLVLSITNKNNYLHSQLFAQSAFGRDLVVIRYIAAPGITIPCRYRCWRCTSVACVFASSRMMIRQVWTGCLLFTAVDACSALDDAMQQSYRCSQQAYTATRLSLVAAVAALGLQSTYQMHTAFACYS